MVCEHHGLGRLGGAGGEKQKLSRSVRYAGREIGPALLHKRLVAPERVKVCVGDQALKRLVGGIFVEQHHLHARLHGGKDLDHARKAAVTKHAKTGLALAGKHPGARIDLVFERAVGYSPVLPKQGRLPAQSLGLVGQKCVK